MVVPGYGMAVAQAQRAVADLATELEKRGVEVLYAIHPVAGRMPGHMNVLLAEADVPYDKLKEMDDINGEFARTDVVARDRRQRRHQPGRRAPSRESPIYGMPILDVDKSGSVIVLKRSMSRLRRHRQPALLRPQDRDALRRRQDLRVATSCPRSRRSEIVLRMEEDVAGLRAEIGELMEQVMESMGVGTLMIPDEIQRGMNETANPSLDGDGLRALRDDLKALLYRGTDEFRAAGESNCGECIPWHSSACADP